MNRVRLSREEKEIEKTLLRGEYVDVGKAELLKIKGLFQKSRQYARQAGLTLSDLKRAIQRVRRSSR